MKKELSEKVTDYVSINMKDWLEQTMKKEAIRAAKAANLPDPFIENIQIEESNNGYLLVNDWIDEGKPLGIWFNYGTVDHYIKPKNPKGVLAWNAKEGRNPRPAIYYKGQAKEGDPLFSKGHYVAGLPRTEAMEIGYKMGKPKLERLIKKMVKIFVSQQDVSRHMKVTVK